MLDPRQELLPYKGGCYLWKYVPSLALAVTYLALFAILSIAHTWKMFRYRVWFCLPFAVGGYREYLLRSMFVAWKLTGMATSVEVVSCLGRIIARNTTDELMPYIIQSFFCLFVAVAILFDRRYRRRTAGGFKSLATSSGLDQPGHLSEPPFDWKKLMLMLYETSGLILFRCIFRIVEYIMGPDAYLLATEWPLFAFDLTLMVITMVLFYVWHPVLIKPATDDSRSLRMELLSENTTYGGGATGKTT
jgi:hypothetical protein